MAVVYANVASIVAKSKSSGVKDAVHARAEILATRARGLLAQHRETGASKIEVTKGRVDSFVSLVDPAAMSIEFGRHAHPDGRDAMQGLYILHRTIGMSGGP